MDVRRTWLQGGSGPASAVGVVLPARAPRGVSPPQAMPLGHVAAGAFLLPKRGWWGTAGQQTASPRLSIRDALVASALGWVLRTLRVRGNPSTLCPKEGTPFPSVPLWDLKWLLTAAVHPTSCLAGLRRRRRGGCAVRCLPSQEV